MRPPIVPRAVALSALSALATLTAATLATAGPPLRPTDARALAQPPAPALRPYVRPVDRWLGETRAVAVEGHLAYYAVGRGIAVADVRDPASPRLVGRSAALAQAPDDAVPPPISSVAAADGIVWAVTRQAADGVAVFDARDPRRPRLVAQVPLAGGLPHAVAARGWESVVALQTMSSDLADGGLVVLRLEPDGRVVEVARWHDASVNRNPSDVVWVGDRILAGGSPNDIASFAITGPVDGPRELVLSAYHSIEWASSGVTHLAVDGCRLYALGHDGWDGGGGDGGVTAYDICQDGAPVRLGWFGSPDFYERAASGVAAVTLGGRSYVLVADSYGGVVALDATAPAAPEWPATPLVGPVTGVHGCRSDIAVAGRVVLSTGCGLTTTTLADNQPRATRSGHLLGLSSYGQLWSDGVWRSQAAMAGSNIVVVHASVAQVVDPAAPIAPAVLGRVGIAPGGDPRWYQIVDIAATERTAWIAGVNSPVLAVDIRDPRAPVVLGDLGTAATAVAAGGDLVAASGWPLNSIVLFDVADPAQPREVGRVAADTGSVHDLVFHGDRLYASDGPHGLQVIDVGDPTRPRVMAANGTDDALGVAVDDQVAVATGSTGLVVYDLAGVAQGRLDVAARVPFADLGVPEDGNLHAERLALAHYGGRRIALLYRQRPAALVAVDVTDPANPIAGPPRRLPIPFEAMATDAGRVYMFSGFAGAEFSVFDAGAMAVAAAISLPFLAAGGF